MRTMLKVQLPVEAGSEAIVTGRISEIIGVFVERYRPEALYFAVEEGKRAAYAVFDLKDPADIPVVVEPLFQGLRASAVLTPVLTLDELQKGLREFAGG